MSSPLAASTTRPAVADGQQHQLEADVFTDLAEALNRFAWTATVLVADYWHSVDTPDHRYEIATGQFTASTTTTGLIVGGQDASEGLFYRIFLGTGDETYQISPDGLNFILTDGDTRVEITFLPTDSLG